MIKLPFTLCTFYSGWMSFLYLSVRASVSCYEREGIKNAKWKYISIGIRTHSQHGLRNLIELPRPLAIPSDHYVKAILRLFIYKALYDQSYLGSKTTMTTGEWSCLISFAWYPLTMYLFGTARRERKIQNENICLQRDSNPRLATTRLAGQRFRPLGYDTLMKIWRLMSYWIDG